MSKLKTAIISFGIFIKKKLKRVTVWCLIIYLFLISLSSYFYYCSFKKNVDSFIFNISMNESILFFEKNEFEKFEYRDIYSGKIPIQTFDFNKLIIEREDDFNQEKAPDGKLFYATKDYLLPMMDNDTMKKMAPEFVRQLERDKIKIEEACDSCYFFFIITENGELFFLGESKKTIDSLQYIRRKYLLDKYNQIDFIYFSILASTGTSYGDIVPNSTLVRICLSIQLITSLILIGVLTGELNKSITRNSLHG